MVSGGVTSRSADAITLMVRCPSVRLMVELPSVGVIRRRIGPDSYHRAGVWSSFRDSQATDDHLEGSAPSHERHRGPVARVAPLAVKGVSNLIAKIRLRQSQRFSLGEHLQGELPFAGTVTVTDVVKATVTGEGVSQVVGSTSQLLDISPRSSRSISAPMETASAEKLSSTTSGIGG